MRSVAWLAYDDDFLYAAFEFDEPDPGTIRAPLGDRDDVRSYTDYGGVILDSQNDGHTAQLFLANARGIQYDALSNDASGEDELARLLLGQRGEDHRYRLGARDPHSLLLPALHRSRSGAVGDPALPQPAARLPLPDVHLAPAARLELLHLQLAAARRTRRTRGGLALRRGALRRGEPGGRAASGLGSPLASDAAEFDGGVDAKWIPNPSTAIDATVNPDFSQIESDAGQITANERFALFFPEKRPFFLEGVESPPDADPGGLHPHLHLAALRPAGDRRQRVDQVHRPGRPGPRRRFGDPPRRRRLRVRRSGFRLLRRGRPRAPRLREGRSSSFLYTGRENASADGGGSNRVARSRLRVATDAAGHGHRAASLLLDARRPTGPSSPTEWDGRKLEGHAAKLWAQHATETWDLFGQYEDFSDEFRADNGFVPQVGYRMLYVESGRTWRPVEKKVSRVRLFGIADRAETQGGELLSQEFVPGVGMDATLEFVRPLRIRLRRGGEPGGDLRPLPVPPAPRDPPWQGRAAGDARRRSTATTSTSPTIARPMAGAATLTADLQPTDHLALGLSAARRILDVATSSRARLAGRLFTADLARLRAVYTFNARSWLRLIGEWAETERNPALYTFDVRPTSGDFAGSAVFAYKLNWQTVFFLGVGDERTQDPEGDLQPLGRQAFFKLSYAFQH